MFHGAMTKAMLFCRLVNWTRLAQARAWWQKHTNRRYFSIIAYHRIVDQPRRQCPLDGAMISATAREFDWEMRFVKRYFRVVSFAELQDLLASGATPPRNLLLITFDDGYRDNYTTAYPILRRYGLPATIFVVPTYLGTGVAPWWDRVNYFLKHTPQCQINLCQIEPLSLRLDTWDQRLAAAETVLTVLKRVPEEDREELLAELHAACGVDVPEELARDLFCSWDEVREMSSHGIEIGAHSLTHPILSRVTDEARLAEEIGRPRQIIAERIGRTPTAMAYPVGGLWTFDARVLRLVAEAGYDFGVSYVQGINEWSRLDRYALRRIRTEVYDDTGHFRAKLGWPEWVRY
jgi:peptidoglycan/xylan/chitin deacetylase (PgdA/CDA1 family)